MVSEPQEELQQGREFAELFRNGKGRRGELASRSLAAGSPREPALDGDQVHSRIDGAVDCEGGDIPTTVRAAIGRTSDSVIGEKKFSGSVVTYTAFAITRTLTQFQVGGWGFSAVHVAVRHGRPSHDIRRIFFIC